MHKILLVICNIVYTGGALFRDENKTKYLKELGSLIYLLLNIWVDFYDYKIPNACKSLVVGIVSRNNTYQAITKVKQHCLASALKECAFIKNNNCDCN